MIQRWMASLALTLYPAMAFAAPAAGEHSDTGHGAEPSLFAGTIAQSISAIVVFLILYAILHRHAWGPILKGLQERELKIKSDLEHAEQSAKQAQQTLDEYRMQLAEAQEEARKLIEQGKADAERIGAQLRSQTEQEVAQLRQRAQADIRSAKEQALAELYTQAATLSTQVAGRILQRQISDDDSRRLVDEAVSKLNQN